MYGTDEQDINFPTPIPVHITYQTAFVDDDGKLQIRPDIYGLDAALATLISSERGVIEIRRRSGPGESRATGRSRARVRTAGASAHGRLLRIVVRRRPASRQLGHDAPARGAR